jgi:hypothetical protein
VTSFHVSYSLFQVAISLSAVSKPFSNSEFERLRPPLAFPLDFLFEFELPLDLDSFLDLELCCEQRD